MRKRTTTFAFLSTCMLIASIGCGRFLPHRQTDYQMAYDNTSSPKKLYIFFNSLEAVNQISQVRTVPVSNYTDIVEKIFDPMRGGVFTVFHFPPSGSSSYCLETDSTLRCTIGCDVLDPATRLTKCTVLSGDRQVPTSGMLYFRGSLRYSIGGTDESADLNSLYLDLRAATPKPSVTPGCSIDTDFDCDGINNAVDTCITVFGIATNTGCPAGDTDHDGHQPDNCPSVSNRGQLDSDGDGVGDECDNCQYNSNPDQRNTDSATRDSAGDVCDGDADGDGISERRTDTGVITPDSPDQCPTVPGLLADRGCPPSSPVERSRGGASTPCTDDPDDDGVCGASDACPEEAADTDNGCPETSDPDSRRPPDADNDGVPDSADLCPNESEQWQMSNNTNRQVSFGSIPTRVPVDGTADGCPPDADLNRDRDRDTNSQSDGGGCGLLGSITMNPLGFLILAMGLIPLAIKRMTL